MSAWAIPALMNGNPARASAAKNLRNFQLPRPVSAHAHGFDCEVSLADVFANLFAHNLPHSGEVAGGATVGNFWPGRPARRDDSRNPQAGW
jgi:hypothetical protein